MKVVSTMHYVHHSKSMQGVVGAGDVLVTQVIQLAHRVDFG